MLRINKEFMAVKMDLIQPISTELGKELSVLSSLWVVGSSWRGQSIILVMEQ